MTLAPLDWIIIAAYLLGCVIAGVWMRRYVRNVEDFAVAGRKMDVHLGIASLAATEVGIVTVMYTAEMGFKNGLAGATPGVLGCLAMLFVGLTGFVIVPLRRAGVMTIPELFENRFGKPVRWLAGLVVILGGVLNMGIFLRLGGDFLMYVSGLDPRTSVPLSIFGLEWNFRCLEVVMTGLLALVLLYTVLGGMISVLVTDYLQFLVMGLGIVVTSLLVVFSVGWPNLLQRLPEAHELTLVLNEAERSAQAAGEAACAAGAAAPDPASLALQAKEAFEQADGQRQRLFEKARTAHQLAQTAAQQASSAADPAVAAQKAAMLAQAAQLWTEKIAAVRGQAMKDAKAAVQQARHRLGRLAYANEQLRKASRQTDKMLGQVNAARLKAEILEQAARIASQRSEEASDPGHAAGQSARLLAREAAVARQESTEWAAKVEWAERGRRPREQSAARAAAAAQSAATSAKLAAEKLSGAIGPLRMADPFNPFSPNGLGWAWFTWQALTQIAVMTTWQTTITRVLSCRDARTAKQMYCRTSFYWVGRFGLPGLWGIGAFLYFWKLGGLPEGADSLRAMPAYLHTILPVGLLGLVIAAMLAAEMSTDSGYLVTWATVIYNDLICPCLRKPLSPRGKLLTIRTLVLGIGIFLVFYGLWYPLPGAAWDYLAVTGNIYLASLFTLLVGALYWPGANSWGAVAAIVLGAIGPLSFVIVNAIVPPESQIPAAVAGWSAFGLSFAGMLVGSMIGRVAGRANRGSLPADRPAQETPA
ncbi:MAG: sodium:solute symporter family transporter [Thermoguttaceae bacterium]